MKSDSLELFREIAASLPEAKLSSMFGCPCIKAANGKAGAFLWRGRLIVKPAPDVLPTMLRKGFAEFCPKEGGLPMAGWIVVEETEQVQWNALATESFERVARLPPNRK